MAESAKVDELVDLGEDNYMEEMDDDVEEQVEDNSEGGDGNFEENDEEEEYDHSKAEASEKDELPDTNRNDIDSLILNMRKQKISQLLPLVKMRKRSMPNFLPSLLMAQRFSSVDFQRMHRSKPIGDIFEVSFMKDKDSGESKGFAFVAFRSKGVAKKAIDELHSKEFKGKTIRCSLSETRNRLFIGNVPKIWTADEFRKVIEDVGSGIETIEFIKVKALYVKNIPQNTSTVKIKALFRHHGEVMKVVMPAGKSGKHDFGLIHYAPRSSALKTVKDTEKYEIDGQVLEAVLAKPQTDKKTDWAFPYGAGLVPAHIPHTGYGGFAGTSYGSVGAGFGVASGFQQVHRQKLGVQMPPPRSRRVDRSNGPGGRGGRGGSSGGDGGNRGRRYGPYC